MTEFSSVLSAVCIVILSIWLIIKSIRTVPRPNITSVLFLHEIDFKVGDIILYHCNPFINWFTNSSWSHVGIVLIGKSGKPRIFEITGSNHYATAKPLIKELENELKNGNYALAMRRINPPLNDTQKKQVNRFARRVLREKIHYEHVYWREFYQRLYGNFFPIHISNNDRISRNSTICSSLIAELLQEVNVLSKTTHPLSILPHDFSEQSNRPVKFLKPYKLEPLINIKIKSCN